MVCAGSPIHVDIGVGEVSVQGGGSVCACRVPCVGMAVDVPVGSYVHGRKILWEIEVWEDWCECGKVPCMCGCTICVPIGSLCACGVSGILGHWCVQGGSYVLAWGHGRSGWGSPGPVGGSLCSPVPRPGPNRASPASPASPNSPARPEAPPPA